MNGICGNKCFENRDLPLRREVNLRKAYSLDFVWRSARRALPYANMRKAFSLEN